MGSRSPCTCAESLLAPSRCNRDESSSLLAVTPPPPGSAPLLLSPTPLCPLFVRLGPESLVLCLSDFQPCLYILKPMSPPRADHPCLSPVSCALQHPTCLVSRKSVPGSVWAASLPEKSKVFITDQTHKNVSTRAPGIQHVLSEQVSNQSVHKSIYASI